MKVDLKLTEGMSFDMREAYRTLRTNVEFCGDDIHAIAITSCVATEGKSTTSFNLACVMAESGKKILFIDGDLRRSLLMRRYHVRQSVKGLTHFLSGQNKRDEVICETNILNLDIIFSGPIPPNPSELLGNKYFKELIVEVKKHYDYIIIDTPPLGAVIDGAIIARECDGAILVLENNNVRYKTAQAVKKQLEMSGCRFLGAVLNKIDVKKNGYYKRYYRKYYKKYDYNSAYTKEHNEDKK